MTLDEVRHQLAILERSLGMPIPELPWNESVGMPYGAVCPDLGPGVEELRCVSCGATWAGIAGDPCWWCQRSKELLIEVQVDLLLTPPEVDPDDVTYTTRMKAWADRMVVGIDAGLITARQAKLALRGVDQ